MQIIPLQSCSTCNCSGRLLGCPLNAGVSQDSFGPTSLTTQTPFLLPGAFPSTVRLTPGTATPSPLLSPGLHLSPFHLFPQHPQTEPIVILKSCPSERHHPSPYDQARKHHTVHWSYPSVQFLLSSPATCHTLHPVSPWW